MPDSTHQSTMPLIASSSGDSNADPKVTQVTEHAPEVDSALWLRRSDQLFVGVMVTVLTVLLGIQWLRLSNWGASPVELSSQKPREYYYSLDINAASWVEWAQLDGIGEKLARRIVADREERGPFRNPADVGRVRGIGPKVLEKLKPFLHGGTASTIETRKASP